MKRRKAIKAIGVSSMAAGMSIASAAGIAQSVSSTEQKKNVEQNANNKTIGH